MATTRPDLMLLEWMRPKQSGIDLARQLKAGHASGKIPIIMLTARHNEADKEIGLDAGIDDYVTEPLSTGELSARVRAVRRRALSELARKPDIHVEERTVNVHVRRLRQALAPSGHGCLVQTVRGPGYRLSHKRQSGGPPAFQGFAEIRMGLGPATPPRRDLAMTDRKREAAAPGAVVVGGAGPGTWLGRRSYLMLVVALAYLDRHLFQLARLASRLRPATSVSGCPSSSTPSPVTLASLRSQAPWARTAPSRTALPPRGS